MKVRFFPSTIQADLEKDANVCVDMRPKAKKFSDREIGLLYKDSVCQNIC